MSRVVLFMVIFLGGCAVLPQKLFAVKMMSGETLYARAEPKKDSAGFYHFEDVNKQAYIIEEKLILYISPTDFKH